LSTALQEISYFIREEKKKKTLLGFEKTIILDFNIEVYLTTLALLKKKKKQQPERVRGEKKENKREKQIHFGPCLFFRIYFSGNHFSNFFVFICH
jgi:hypothetical protein